MAPSGLAWGVNHGLVVLISSLLAFIHRLLGTSFRHLLRAARRLAEALRWLLSLAAPQGLSLQIGRTVASRVQQLLEHSATVALTQEPLETRLLGVPTPVAAYLRAALGGLGGKSYKCAACLARTCVQPRLHACPPAVACGSFLSTATG